jgi:hypothetical protein
MVIVPKECYEEYGTDLDGCSRQENEGCKGCRCAKEIRTNREVYEEAAGMGLDDMFFRFNHIDPDAEYKEGE